jgi:hypothetical protein
MPRRRVVLSNLIHGPSDCIYISYAAKVKCLGPGFGTSKFLFIGSTLLELTSIQMPRWCVLLCSPIHGHRNSMSAAPVTYRGPGFGTSTFFENWFCPLRKWLQSRCQDDMSLCV